MINDCGKSWNRKKKNWIVWSLVTGEDRRERRNLTESEDVLK